MVVEESIGSHGPEPLSGSMSRYKPLAEFPGVAVATGVAVGEAGTGVKVGNDEPVMRSVPSPHGIG
jgi:hypothetical protein